MEHGAQPYERTPPPNSCAHPPLQAATIFPKNIHYIGTIMHIVARRLGVPVGAYTHFVTTLVDGRES